MNYSCNFLVDRYLKCKRKNEKNPIKECRLYFELLKYCVYDNDNY